jgi:cysteinyl-tRNA synthetase
MDTSTFSDYGALLSDKHLAGLEEGSRVDLKGKRNPTDFALWKFNMTGAKRDMERDSPWGV